MRTFLFAILLIAVGILIGVVGRNEVRWVLANILSSYRAMFHPHEPFTDRALTTPQLDELLTAKGVTRGTPVFIRIFKAERELELWMGKAERFTRIKTYPICAFSGALGPKLKEGDRQSPEGFYKVGRGALNPNSAYHLSFNLGFPNAYDRAHQRTGSYLMVHGDCVSIGCYAMTNSGIEELYGLVQAALRNGQGQVQVHAFPFRMSAANIDRYSNHEWIDFWRNLKEGYDVFEATLRPPGVRVSGKRYVFDPPPLSMAGN
ncbi:L,D-transpeptidase family protein [Candidatus Thiosymbion oneisti]|uniref:L,D-transpeptidase family protein n=1 Tax=Candidatus Thiosymbion oneisti TaxID=589554 RepID=UPI001A9C684D|nr:murein L,D-transpeptidase family protein [Candidatus Thiosymbion oneisti]